MYDLIVLAFQTDMTRVATFSTGNEGNGPAVPEIGIKQDRHSLSHHNANPKGFQWTAKADAILEKVRRARAALDKIPSA